MGRFARILSNFYLTGSVSLIKKDFKVSSKTAKCLNVAAIVINWALLPFSLVLVGITISECNSRSKDHKVLQKLILSLANDDNASFVVELLKKNDGDIIYTIWTDEDMAKKFLNISGMEENLSQIKRLKYVLNKINKKKVEENKTEELQTLEESQA